MKQIKFKTSCNFSYAHYIEILNYAKTTYSIGRINDHSKFKNTKKFILLRHDVDYSLDLSLKLAKIESKNKIYSTYFILLHSQYYNALSPHNQEIIKLISSLGHEIGLHYDTNSLSKNAKKAIHELEMELEILGRIINKKIYSIAMHNVTISPKITFMLKSKDIVDVSPNFLKDIFYISDSAQNWRQDCMCKHIGNVHKLQINTHPMWWNIHHKSRKMNFNRFEIDEIKKIKHENSNTQKLYKIYFKNLK